MLEYNVTQTQDENLLITIIDTKYKGVVAKVVDLKFEENGEPTFELELPSTKTHLFDDEDFINNIQEIVGDIIRKSVDFIWNTQEELIEINEQMLELLKLKNISVSTDITEIERMMLKGFLLRKEDNNLYAVDMSENKEYDLANDDDFEFIRQKIYSNIILN